MTQEDKQLLLQDLCSRLPYGVKITFAGYSGRDDCILNSQHLNSTYAIVYLRLKPYLRPMSSMTEEERDEFQRLDTECDKMPTFDYVPIEHYRIFDWLNAHHFDYRGLIPKNLAISTEKFNPYKD